jgi:hypothetical protein
VSLWGNTARAVHHYITYIHILNAQFMYVSTKTAN